MVKNDRSIGYQMTKRMFDSILMFRGEEDKKQNPYQFVMNYLNEQGGLIGTVRHISVARD